MKRLMAATALVVVLGCGSRREVTGRLFAAHPPDTAVVATGQAGAITTTLAADGSFSLPLPSHGTFRVRFVTVTGLRRGILGTVAGKDGRPISFRSDGRSVALGAIGRGQALPAEGAPCAGDGTSLDAEKAGGEEAADAGDEVSHDDVCGDGEHDGGEHEDGEHDGGEHEDGDHDGGHHHDHDGGGDDAGDDD
jgi:hypothetical protein